MMRTRALVRAALVAAIASAAWPVLAQSYPSRPVRIVVPFAAGGSTDAMARIVGQKMAEGLGQPVVIENRPGAAGGLGSEQVARSPADGYTLLMATTSTHAILPVANPRLGYDAVKDFAPVGLVARAPNVLVVGPGLGVGSVDELLKLARSRPAQLTFASSGTGSITHLVGELFAASGGIKAMHVPYKTGVQALPDVASGQVAFQFDSITWTVPQARAGKLRALAVTGPTRSPLAPDLPTVAESGLPGFEGITWFGFVAPAATPPDALARLGAELSRALANPEVREKLAAQGAEAATGQPQELSRLMREDGAKWAKVIRDAGVKFE
ncbi:MAG: tripartite tricarboxylate transporter substrate binding protein [Burkholderiales bacterium]|nr:tripartite tricarboxylate transporter substrate binding protein [Burkholderiales bacterium]